MAGLLAGIRIHDDRPDVQVEAHWFGESVPPGFNDKLVRVFLNHDDLSTVAQTPVVGLACLMAALIYGDPIALPPIDCTCKLYS
uniref:Uncharacterized protein n=1 Tax=Arundo donax TaxID=35708 RepID=A0A0A8Y2Q2_ARUDO